MNLYLFTSGGPEGEAPGRIWRRRDKLTEALDNRFVDRARETGLALEALDRFLVWLAQAVERFPRREKFLLGDRQRKQTCRAGERGGFRQRRGAVYRGDCSDDPSPQPSPSRGEGAKCRGNPLWLPGSVVARFCGGPVLGSPAPVAALAPWNASG